ncbi:MAG: hypothetical protein D3913_06940 [Candidatus Electrothrix sp. LOE1_4_5]|nr:hypothetical protein [Candidatus Electrothrix gigas]
MKNNTSATQDQPPAALDFHTLRREGIRHIERLGSKVWTDYNSHDPGITILEQLCYALTDLLYRIDYPVQDLLAEGGSDPFASLFPPEEILPSGPVTLLDLRKFILDIDGVRNAWVERFEPKVNDDEPELYFNRQKKTLTLSNDGQGEPLIIKGLYQVWVEPEAEQDEAKLDELENDIREYLHGFRSLCEDFIVTVLRESKKNDSEKSRIDIEKIGVTASIEIDTAADSAKLRRAVFQQIEDYFSPPVQFHSLKERLESIKYIDEIFEGPLLTKGFIDNKELKNNIRRTELRTSDLIRLFMDVKGVLAVQKISFTAENIENEKWLLKLEKGIIPRLDNAKSNIEIIQGQGVPLSVIKEDTADLSRPPGIDELPRPVSQGRHITGNYFSVQHQFPDCYGINSRGLPGSVSSLRKAQAKQLKAYLTLFDQLLANEFAQLANTGKLFSFTENDASTYFYQLLDDPDLGLDEERPTSLGIWKTSDKNARRENLETSFRNIGESDKNFERKNRFLEHLSTRFAEQALPSLPHSQDAQEKQIKRKQDFLQQYADTSRVRNTGTGLEQRIRLKLGIDEATDLYLIEHILLRPIKEDKEQNTAILHLASDITDGDPYSLRVSVVLPKNFLAGNFPENEKRFEIIKQYILEEIPAHLAVNFLWLDDVESEESESKLQEFKTAYESWQKAISSTSNRNQQVLRATRDRLIDLLGIGKTYPLSDLEVSDKTVIYGEQADININTSQTDVLYLLFDKNGNDQILNTDKNPITAQGNGKKISITTPPIEGDALNVTYSIQARKNNFSIFLQKKSFVNVGLNPDLEVEISKEIDADNNELNPSPISGNDTPVLIHYRHRVKVLVHDPQNGVLYRLLPAELSREDVSREGNSEFITLESTEISQDTVIKIEADKSKSAHGAENTEKDIQPLKKELPLLVRADTTAEVTPYQILPFGEDSTVKIKTQTGVSYHAFQHKLADDEFVYNDGHVNLLKIPVSLGYPDVQVKSPEWKKEWDDEGYIPIGYKKTGTKLQGNGQGLTLPISTPQDDSLIIIRAEKEHKGGYSAVQLKQAVVLLVTPNPKQVLSLQLHIKEGNKYPHVAGGEVGVFYHFRLEKNGDEICLPAYFHQWAEDDTEKDKGIGHLRIEGDFVVVPSENPKSPLLKIKESVDLSVGTPVYIRARKARTNVSIDMELPIGQ